MFRPSVSHTVCKRRIRRALTAGKSGTPVIFDIISNFENLYSMGVIEREMACAVSYCSSLGGNEKNSVDKFEIIGIVKDCAELFDKLNDTFTAVWDGIYRCTCEYCFEYGKCQEDARLRAACPWATGFTLKGVSAAEK